MTRQQPQILLTHTPQMRENYYGETALAALAQLGTVRLHEADEPLDGKDLVAAARGCDLIVADRQTAFPADVIAELEDAIAILRVAVDIRNIDVVAASQAGILVTQASRSWVPAVAELVVGLMIDASRGISAANIAYKAGKAPTVHMGRQLSGATAGIIGFGPLGQRVAEILVALGMRVIVDDPYVEVMRPDIEQVRLEELLAEADYVVPLAVATEETENLIDATALSRMKPSAILVNLSRGNLVDEAALAAALDGRRIAGAAMDVGRAPDQMPSPVLACRPDVVATPHIGGLTPQAIMGQASETTRQAASIIDGIAPQGAVNGAEARRLTSWRERRQV